MDELTIAEKEALSNYFGTQTPIPEEKYNVHTFLNKVATSSDTTKTGYLKEEEVGLPKLPIRAFKNMALISDKIMGVNFFKEFFEAESENITSTSLSRDAKLLTLAVIQKKVLEDITPPRKENKGWFKKKEPEKELT